MEIILVMFSGVSNVCALVILQTNFILKYLEFIQSKIVEVVKSNNLFSAKIFVSRGETLVSLIKNKWWLNSM